MSTTVGLASRRAGESGVANVVVVGGVLLAIFGERRVDLRLELGEVGVCGPRHKQRANLGADEVVGATGAEEGQLLAFVRS